ncbi:hypothetical protein [Streptomyces sp. NPDC053367]
MIVFDSDTLTIKDKEYARTVDRVVKAVRDEPGVDRARGSS